MMRAWIFALGLALAPGCKKSATPTTPPTTSSGSAAGSGSAACGEIKAGEPMAQEQCTCLGARVNASRGGEQEHCAAGETEIGTVRLGIEGGWCCKGP